MVVVDTNIISDMMRFQPHPSVMAWVNSQSSDRLFTTAVSQAEILVGIAMLPAGKKKDALASAADIMLRQKFRDRVLSFDAASADAFASLVATRRRGGRPISLFDAQIAAIVVANRATLATRNVEDFLGCGFDVINPWV